MKNKESKDYKDELIERLKKSNYFNEEALASIREDLDLLTEKELKEKQKEIDKNTKKIIETISKKEIIRYFRYGLFVFLLIFQ